MSMTKTVAYNNSHSLRQWLSGFSLSKRLIAGLIVALTVSGGLLVMISLSLGQGYVRNEQEVAAMRLVKVFESGLQNAMLHRDLSGLESILVTLGQAPGVESALLLNAQAKVRFSSRSADMDKQQSDTLHGLCLPPACVTMQPEMRWLEQKQGLALQIAYPIANQTRCFQCHGSQQTHPINGVLVVDLKPVDTDARQNPYRVLLITGLAVLLLFSAMMVWTLRREVFRPLRQLSNTANRIAEGDFSARINWSRQDELGQVGRQFDAMASRIDSIVQSLETQQRFLQQLVDAIPDPILVIGPDWRIRIANTAYCELVGQSLDQIINTCCYRTGRGQDEPCPATLVTCPVVEARQNRSLRTIMTLRQRDGSEIPVEIDAVSLSYANEELTVEVLRPLDKTIRYSQEQRLSTIGLLANGVAHEIHNPLASIRLALQASLRGLRRNDISQIELIDYLELVDDQIDRCVLATQRLMQMSQPPSPSLGNVLLDEAIEDVLALLAEEIRIAYIRVERKISPPDIMLMADPTELRQIFVNLIHNAIHAMPKGGIISISGVVTKDNKYLIKVSDTGCGIAPDDLPRIFLPFFSRRADGKSGMGLGLAISKSLVVRFGGSISVSSEVGRGTEFQITLTQAPAGALPHSHNSDYGHV
ncbi:MAG: HAMP domain-containing protein [Polaromonas sp.]|jgi:signal transduction histidine kinase|nr:HAMP domain-containing protein [Polaromonas sp.]